MRRQPAAMPLLLLACSQQLPGRVARVVSGTVSSRSAGWGFMGWFVFDWAPEPVYTDGACGHQPPGMLPGQENLGQVHIKLQADTRGSFTWRTDGHNTTREQRLWVLLYDDQPDSFPAVYGDTDNVQRMPCAERAAFFKYHPLTGKRTGHVPCDGRIEVDWDQDGHFEFTRTIVQHLRPRVWYVVLALENCTELPAVGFELTFTNPPNPGGSQFGVNEYGLNLTYFVFFLGHSLLLIVQKKSRQL